MAVWDSEHLSDPWACFIASLSALSTRTVQCNAEGAWVLGHSGILQRETQGCSTKVREPAGQPAGAATDGVFVDGVLDQGWASAL